MKKFLPLLLCLCLIFALCSCGNGDPQGDYVLQSFTMDDISYSIDQLETMGLDSEVSISFHEDQSGILRFGGKETSFTWDGKNLLSEGDSLPYRFEEGKVILSYQGTEMVFAREN